MGVLGAADVLSGEYDRRRERSVAAAAQAKAVRVAKRKAAQKKNGPLTVAAVVASALADGAVCFPGSLDYMLREPAWAEVRVGVAAEEAWRCPGATREAFYQALEVRLANRVVHHVLSECVRAEEERAGIVSSEVLTELSRCCSHALTVCRNDEQRVISLPGLCVDGSADAAANSFRLTQRLIWNGGDEHPLWCTTEYQEVLSKVFHDVQGLSMAEFRSSWALGDKWLTVHGLRKRVEDALSRPGRPCACVEQCMLKLEPALLASGEALRRRRAR